MPPSRGSSAGWRPRRPVTTRGRCPRECARSRSWPPWCAPSTPSTTSDVPSGPPARSSRSLARRAVARAGSPVAKNDSFAVQDAQALLVLAGVRHARGDTDGAHAAVGAGATADHEVSGSRHAPVSLDRTERALGRPSRGDPCPRRPSPTGSRSSCGCSRPRCRNQRSPRSSTCRSTPSGPTSRGSIASWGRLPRGGRRHRPRARPPTRIASEERPDTYSLILVRRRR
jgi:hypothetical protein